tara:strand:+ start:1895 stop:2203 length:309 start_codon:yes stop_codon:yes gene_type:complete
MVLYISTLSSICVLSLLAYIKYRKNSKRIQVQIEVLNKTIEGLDEKIDINYKRTYNQISNREESNNIKIQKLLTNWGDSFEFQTMLKRIKKEEDKNSNGFTY